MAKGESVTVPAGTFNCYKYQMENHPKDSSVYQKGIDWICPGIGIIKTEQWSRFNNEVLFLNASNELQSYILK